MAAPVALMGSPAGLAWIRRLRGRSCRRSSSTCWSAPMTSAWAKRAGKWSYPLRRRLAACPASARLAPHGGSTCRSRCIQSRAARDCANASTFRRSEACFSLSHSRSISEASLRSASASGPSTNAVSGLPSAAAMRFRMLTLPASSSSQWRRKASRKKVSTRYLDCG